MLRPQNIAIIGFSREGHAVLKFFQTNAQYKGARICVFDKNASIAVPNGIEVKSGEGYLDDLSGFDMIVRSPGVYYGSPELQRAARAGAVLTSATKLFLELAPCPVIGITGTKGKTTTATLVYHMLRAAGRDAYLAGNVGTPALPLLPRLTKKSIVVLELSSFQLHDTTISPHIVGITEIFPDHLDVHKTMREYVGAKANIVRFQTARDHVAYIASNTRTKNLATRSRATLHPVTTTTTFVKKEWMRIGGAHLFLNVALAAEIARIAGVSKTIIEKTVRSFTGVAHRLQLVATKKLSSGVQIEFYDDSAATNPGATAAAVAAFDDGANVLLAGGADKNLDYAPLASALKKSKTFFAVMLYGQNRKKIAAAFTGMRGVDVSEVDTLQQAVSAAWSALERTTISGIGRVILSPAAASFDQFKDYADRARVFLGILKTLK